MSARPVEIGSPYYELIKPIPRSTKLRLVLEILADYARVRWLLARRDLPSVVARAPGYSAANDGSASSGHGSPARTCRRARLFVLLPFDSRCLAPLARPGARALPPWHRLGARHRRRRRAGVHCARVGRKRRQGLCFRRSTADSRLVEV